MSIRWMALRLTENGEPLPFELADVESAWRDRPDGDGWLLWLAPGEEASAAFEDLTDWLDRTSAHVCRVAIREEAPSPRIRSEIRLCRVRFGTRGQVLFLPNGRETADAADVPESLLAVQASSASAATAESMPAVPDEAERLRWVGACLDAQGLYPQALSVYEQAEAYKSAGSRQGLHRIWSAMGDLLRRSDRPELADRYYRQALRMSPAYEPAWNGWAEGMAARGRAEGEAAAALLNSAGVRLAQRKLAARALARCGMPAEAWKLLREDPLQDPATAIGCLAANNRLTEAIALLSKAKMDSVAEEEEAAGMIALGFWRTGRRIEGQLSARDEVRERHLAAESRLFDETAVSGREDRSTVQCAERWTERALRLRMRELAMRLANAGGVPAARLGKLLHRYGEARAAAETLLCSLRQQEPEIESLLLLAELLYDKGCYADALSFMEQAAATRSERATSTVGRAMCYLKLTEQEIQAGMAPFATDGLRQTLAALEVVPWRTGLRCAALVT